MKFNFLNCGNLSSVVDQNANKLSLSYDAAGLVSSITDTQDRKLRLSHNAARQVTELSDPSGRSWQYGYANGDLVSYTDPAGKVTRFEYAPSGASGDLVRIRTPRGDDVKLSYDSSHRVTEIVRVTDAAAGSGPTTSFATTRATPR